MLFSPQIVARAPLVREARSFAFVASYQNLNTTASTDFTNVDIGAPSATRVIALGVAMGNGSANTTTVSSVTINGVSATRQVVAQRDSSGTNVAEASIWTAAVPTGSSVTVNVTASASLNSVSFRAIFVYRYVGGTEVPSATATTTGASSTSTTINCPAGGNILGVGVYMLTDTNETAGSASKSYAAAQTGLTVGFTGSSGNIAWTELTEDSEQDMAEVISGSQRSALVAASFS